ncbi:MAG: hypothetical protein WAM30_12390, partial [Candidatus Dormiibacterota bacterium]
MDVTGPRDPMEALLLDWLLLEGEVDGPADLTQHQLQEFVWYYAPRKEAVEPGQVAELGEAAARLLEETGRLRAATSVREHTPEVAAAWRRSEDDGYDAFAAAMSSSGVEPPSTALLTWRGVSGVKEAIVREEAARHLEGAIDRGLFAPGQPGWERRQREVLDDWLGQRSPDDSTRTRLQVVHEERREYWARDGSEVRRRIVERVLPLLREPVVRDPDDLTDALRFLLERVDPGVRLTAGGSLPSSIV